MIEHSKSTGSLREQIAAAIFEDRRARYNFMRSLHQHKCPWEDWPPAYRTDYYADADAALAVIRRFLSDDDNDPSNPVNLEFVDASLD